MQEIRRQAIHLFFGLILLFIAVKLNEVEFLLFSLMLLISSILVLFFLKTRKQSLLLSIIKKVERPHEKHLPGFGAIMFFFGFFLLAVFDFLFLRKHLIVFSLIPLIVGDAFSTIIGLKLGKIRITKDKTLEGSIAFIVSSFIVLYAFFPEKIFIIMIASVCGAIIELLPFNDNLSIPVGLAIILSAVKELGLG